MNETSFYSRKARVDLKFRNYHPWINALNAKDDFHMILQFKSELLLVIKHMSKILPPIFLFFSPPLSYCHNHVMNMLLLLLLHMKSLHWLIHYLQNKGHTHWPGIQDFYDLVALFTFWVFISLCSLSHSLYSIQTKPSWCLSFHLCAHEVSISTQVTHFQGPVLSVAASSEKPLPTGSALNCTYLAISTFVYMSKDWSDCLISDSTKLSGIEMLVTF